MADLKKNFSLLIAYLLLIFSLDHIRIEGQQVIDFQIEFYWVVVAAIISILLIPVVRRMTIFRLLIFWGAIFLFVSLVFFSPVGFERVSITLISFIFLEVAVWVTYQLNQNLSAVETLVTGLASYSFPHRAQNLSMAEENIDTEFSRSRRHNRPLSLLMIKPEQIKENEEQLAYQQLRKDLLQHFAAARISQIITESARQTDLIIHDQETGVFMVICTETERENSTVLAERIKTNIAETMKATMKWSVASFPAEALTMEELVKIAQSRLTE